MTRHDAPPPTKIPCAQAPIGAPSPRAARLSLLASTLAALLAASCEDTAPPERPTLTFAPPIAPAPAPLDTRFDVTSGSAVALAPHGASLYIADEDHLAVFVTPADLRSPGETRVVAMPGPPAQIVASPDLVLVTIRTLPTDDARPAYVSLRGPEPTPAAVTRLPASRLLRAPGPKGQSRFWVKKETQPFVDPTLEAIPEHEDRLHSLPTRDKPPPANKPSPANKPPPANTASPDNKPSPANTASPGDAASPGNKPPPSKPAGSKPIPRTGTPAVPLDPNALRKSQGGLLLAFHPDPDRGLVEVSRTLVAPDAWGIGVTPDGKRAVVTSAWSSEVTVIDLATSKALFTSKVLREPRGVAVSADGKTAWVSHLTGTSLTRLDDLDATPRITETPLPTGLARAMTGTTLSASLGYSLVLSPDGKTLFAPRHAIGAEGVGAWWGAPVIDVLDIASGAPLVPAHQPGSPSFLQSTPGLLIPPADWTAHAGEAPSPTASLLQPRAAVYRRKTDTLLVASEGWDALTEVDALAADPSIAVVHTYDLADVYDAMGHYPVRGGAPSAVALSSDESAAYVYCRTTFDVVKVDLTTRRSEWLRLAEDPLPRDAALGRRLYTNARSATLSGRLGCAACHPEGRDDGYVWREGSPNDRSEHERRFLGLRSNTKPRASFERDTYVPPIKVYPRQTPMIAGRARAPGPYGWHAESESLAARILAGTALHRGGWESAENEEGGELIAKVDYLMDYLRSGLVPPPTLARDLTDVERRGKTLFESATVGCATCHKPETEHTDRVAYPVPRLPVRFGFDDEEERAFKTPSLRFIAGTAPYFHDGSAPTLEALIAGNGNRMGNTQSLPPDDKAALVAYLQTL